MKLRVLTCAGLTFAVLSGCSSSESPGSTGPAGGASVGGTGTGVGTANTGGKSSAATGGTSTGGTTSGPVTGVGGQSTATTTAAVATGGSSTGGTTARGSTTAATGGTKATGGSSSNAGGSPTGGNKASGGTTSGTPATGGAPAGGSNATGGSVAAGGTTATKASGGATAATGGSTSNSTGGTTAIATTSTGTQHWVGTWGASPYVDSNSNNTPPFALSNTVIRQVTHVSLGGSQLRVQFSNLWGNGSLVINGAHIALCKASPKVDGSIDVATDKALAFSGSPNVTIAQGKEVWSDPIDFTVANQGNITITTTFGSVPSTLTQHSGSRTTSYFKANGAASDLSAATINGTTNKALWFFISGIDVMADASAAAVVAMGDSITDGRGTDTDANNRWTDVLAARLQGNAATSKITMLNEAIGATNLAGTATTSAQSRFARDVLAQSGVKYVIVLDGINDIIGGAQVEPLKTAYADLISRAHAKGLKIYGGTILPFNGYTSTSGSWSSAEDEVRKLVNTYIKSGAFDGYIDFDAAVADPTNPSKMQATYATWDQTDWLHPAPAGYKKMGETPDLTLFTN